MSTLTPARGPLAEYAKAFLGVHVSQLREARERKDAGASAIELAIITAIIVLLAGVVIGVVAAVIRGRSTEITGNNGGITGG
jgi:ABC-type sulfate transport system permease subunit